MTTLDEIAEDSRAWGLSVFGAFHAEPDDAAPEGTGTLVLLGPEEPGFWATFTASTEYGDGAPDPMDRWSRRAIGAMADTFDAAPLFPFGGPPYQPFQRWAQRSGRAWVSPVGLLVHDVAGLMVSYRGALALPGRLTLPDPTQNPCETCTDNPCLIACPVAALGKDGYDVPACHRFLDSAAGADCMDQGCAVRRSCPVSQRYGRLPEQSAFHMRTFHR